jgi:Gene product 88
MTLKRSNDRKTANLSNRAGKQPLIANAFGLPAGKAYSCPGATSVCESVCYAGKLEKVFPSMRALLEHNWQILSNADYGTMVRELNAMIQDFIADCDKRGAEKAFRIHWDGDFFSREYASAWANVVRRNPDVTFWVYTRSFTDKLNVIDLIADIPNLSVYLSVDVANEEWADVIIAEYPSVMVASLSDTMDNAAKVIERVRGTNRPGAKCPELIGAIPLIDIKGGACFSCQLCPKGKADIRFASSKAGRV